MEAEDCTQVRRDAEPHRAPFLKLLAATGIALGLFACLIIPGLLGLALTLAVGLMADRDLRAMAQGRMDPRGRAEVVKAKRWARFCIGLALVGMTAALASVLGFAGLIFLVRQY